MSQKALEEFEKAKQEMLDDTAAVYAREILKEYFAGMELRDHNAGVEVYSRWYAVVVECIQDGLIKDKWGEKKEENDGTVKL